jgi:predicted GIY-YIG superfamily endonuclease
MKTAENAAVDEGLPNSQPGNAYRQIPVSAAASAVQSRYRPFEVGDVFKPFTLETHPYTYIYALCFAENYGGETFYVGVTVNPQKRLNAHARASATPKIRQNLSFPGSYMRILEVHTDCDWALVREAAIIEQHQKTLVNCMPTKLTTRAIGLRNAAKEGRRC